MELKPQQGGGNPAVNSPATGNPTGSPIDVSVVIATASRAVLLRGALESIMPQAETMGRTEFVIVDDGSNDSTPMVLEEIKRKSKVPFKIVQGARAGVAAARNLGAKNASGKWMASFDDDQLALPGWLQNLVELGEAKQAACVGGELALSLPEGARLDALGLRVRRLLGEHILGDEPQQYPPAIKPATNNALIRRDVFLQVGGYDESFREGAEDKNLFQKIEAAGHVLWFQPKAKALHLIPPRRLQRDMLRWTALRLGSSDVRAAQAYRPYIEPAKIMVKRVLVTLMRDLPSLMKAKLRGKKGDDRELMETWCSVWYTEGFARSLWGVLIAGGGSGFLDAMDFRNRNGERSGVRKAARG